MIYEKILSTLRQFLSETFAGPDIEKETIIKFLMRNMNDLIPVLNDLNAIDRPLMEHISVYQTVDNTPAYRYDYKYLVYRNGMNWTAFRTEAGFKRFLSDYGLTVKEVSNPWRDAKRWEVYGHPFEERMMWETDWEKIPDTAQVSFRLSNGDYTEFKIYFENGKRILAHLNPNVKTRVKIPHFHE